MGYDGQTTVGAKNLSPLPFNKEGLGRVAGGDDLRPAATCSYVAVSSSSFRTCAFSSSFFVSLRHATLTPPHSFIY
jgi:hypothetical protein